MTFEPFNVLYILYIGYYSKPWETSRGIRNLLHLKYLIVLEIFLFRGMFMYKRLFTHSYINTLV